MLATPHKVEAFVKEGDSCSRIGDYFGAVRNYTLAIQCDPGCAHAYNNRATALLQINRGDDALADCAKAVELCPTSASFRANLGSLHRARGDYHASISEYNTALDYSPCVYWLFLLRAHAHYHNGNSQAMLGDYKEAFQINARASARFVARTQRRALTASSADVLRSCSEHLDKDPRDIMTLARRACAFWGLGRKKETTRDLDKIKTALGQDYLYLHMVLVELEKISAIRCAASIDR